MLNPIEKPTAEELRAADIVFQSVTDERRVIRAVVRRSLKSSNPGHCVRPDFVFEMHIPSDGAAATFWQVHEANPAHAL